MFEKSLIIVFIGQAILAMIGALILIIIGTFEKNADLAMISAFLLVDSVCSMIGLGVGITIGEDL